MFSLLEQRLRETEKARQEADPRPPYIRLFLFSALRLKDVLLGRYYLRKANKLNGPVLALGRPTIENRGYLEIGRQVRIASNISRTRLAVKKDAHLSIGDNCWINGAIIAVTQKVQIGNNCRLAPFTHIMDGDFHGLSDRQAKGESAPIIIEDDVWLGTRSMVLKGVTIKKGAVVAAGAVVTRDVEPYTLVGGVPARVLKHLPAD